MLEIVRGRSWDQYHTILDSEDGPPSDLTKYLEEGASVRCQIRGKTAVRNARGFFEHPLVANVSATLLTDSASVLRLFMSRSQTALIPNGDYLIDVLAMDADGYDEVLLPKEAIRVVGFITEPDADGVPAEDLPPAIPDFIDDYETALAD